MKFSDIELGYVYKINIDSNIDDLCIWDCTIFTLIKYIEDEIYNHSNYYIIKILKTNMKTESNKIKIGANSWIAEEAWLDNLGSIKEYKQKHPEYFL